LYSRTLASNRRLADSSPVSTKSRSSFCDETAAAVVAPTRATYSEARRDSMVTRPRIADSTAGTITPATTSTASGMANPSQILWAIRWPNTT
jgi:hypothetical protein